ncbi:menaquinone biosynthesis protein [Candidatus Chlamydia corallus]|uniref:menaquinone biosynthesis protein n=1 Tax=Candidatus Chlamydia corallus TaxID=2038470 RepID=UPI000C2FA7A5|nr:menaquinone biosynthetic enzyme MqnA/MqnD family protein [Candidatus Chlamydia corallus]
MPDQLEPRISLGCVNYINSFPFSLELIKRDDLDCFLAPPADLLNFLIEGKLDVALTSSLGTISHKLSYIRGFGIAAHQRILSVNLYAAPTFFTSPQPRIAATLESRSSIGLFKILCRHLWHVPTPHILRFTTTEVLTQTPANYDGLLLIGDAALKHPEIPGFTTHDLASGWYDLTKLPFVFALLLHRTSWEENPLPNLALEEALEHFESSPENVLQKAHKHTGLNPSLLEEYYTLCHYRLGEEHYESLEQFREYYGTLYQQV